MATRAYLVTLILQELGVWQTGQDLPPEDFRVVDQRLPFLLRAMGKAKVYTVDDPDVYIPDEAVTELARYLAGELAQAFGLADTELATVTQNAGLAELALRQQRTTGPTYAPQRSTYY
jgi:hypothetical protein